MNFIEKYDKVLTLDECNHIISLFKECPFLNRGYAGGNLNLTIKNSINLDLYFGFDDRCKTQGNVEINNIIAPKLRECVDLYKEKYPAICNGVGRWGIDADYHISFFKEKVGGYFGKHCEQGDLQTSPRMLVWMIYLNDAKSGTRFYHQKVDMKSQAGRVVLWPAAWTHTHSGITPNKSDKYIITGWYKFIENSECMDTIQTAT